MTNPKLTALHILEDSINHIHVHATEGEPYHRDYKKYPDLFRMLVRSDLATEKAMRKYFKDQAKQSDGFIDWKLYNKEVKKVKQAIDVNDFFIVDWNKQALNMKVILTKPLIDAIVAGGKMTENDTNIVIGWNSKQPPVQDFLAKHTLKLAGQITKTTKKRILKALQLAISNGENKETASKRVDDIIDDPRRAAMIAHTESVRAFTEGRLEVGKNIGADRKQWDATVGACQICTPIDGKVVKLNEEFTGGDGNKYKAPPAHPNCRCLVRILMPKEKVPKV